MKLAKLQARAVDLTGNREDVDVPDKYYAYVQFKSSPNCNVIPLKAGGHDSLEDQSKTDALA